VHGAARLWAPASAALFVLGAVIGAGLDHLHVWGGVLSYPGVTVSGQAPWVPVVFGIAGVALSLAAVPLAGETARPVGPGAFARDGALLLAAYLITSFSGWATPPIAVALTAAWIAWAAVIRAPRWRVAHAAVVVVLGVGVEGLLTATGALRHAHADVLGLPWWLAPLYLWSAPLFADAGEWLAAPRRPGLTSTRPPTCNSRRPCACRSSR